MGHVGNASSTRSAKLQSYFFYIEKNPDRAEIKLLTFSNLMVFDLCKTSIEFTVQAVLF